MDNWTLWFITAKGVREISSQAGSEAVSNMTDTESGCLGNDAVNFPTYRFNLACREDGLDVTQRVVRARSFEMPAGNDETSESQRVFISR